jgi:hypothetical protein
VVTDVRAAIALSCGLLAACVASSARAQAIPVELREGELAVSAGMPAEVALVYAFRALPVPLTLGATALPLVEGGSLSVGLRPVVARFADHRVVLTGSVGALALGLGALSFGGRGDVSLQVLFTAARLSDVSVLVALVPGLDAAVVGGEAEGWRVRVGTAASLGLSWPGSALWLEAEAGATFDGVGAPALRGAARIVAGVRL